MDENERLAFVKSCDTVSRIARMFKTGPGEIAMSKGVYGPPCPQHVLVTHAVKSLQNEVDTLRENLHSIGR